MFVIPQLVSIEGCSLIRTFLWSATQRCLSAFCWASSADIRLLFPWIVISQQEISECSYPEIMMYLCPQIIKTKQDMEVITIERSTYEELLTSFNSFVTKMKETAKWGYDLETQLLHQSTSSCLLLRPLIPLIRLKFSIFHWFFFRYRPTFVSMSF